MSEQDVEALAAVILENFNACRGKGGVSPRLLAQKILASGFARQPAVSVVETVEELEALPVGTVIGSRLAGGEWSVATKNAMEDGWEDFDWTIDGHAGKCSRQGVVERMGFPLVVLTPATQPTVSEPVRIPYEFTEAQVEAAAKVVRDHPITICDRGCVCEDDTEASLELARAALTAAAKVGGE